MAGHLPPRTCSSRSKLPGYILPAVPAVAFLLARAVAGVLEREDRDARGPLFGTALVFAGTATAFAVPEVFISGVPGLPLEAVRPLAPILGLASLAVDGFAYWRREVAVVAAVALGFAAAIGYLNAWMLPRLDPLVSPRAIARIVQEAGQADRVQAYRLHRAWHYGLNYYLDRELPEWDERGGPSLVVTNADGVRTLKSLDVPVKILDDVSVEAVLVRVPAPSAGRATQPRRPRPPCFAAAHSPSPTMDECERNLVGN